MFIGVLWIMSHAAWNQLMHALHGNGDSADDMALAAGGRVRERPASTSPPPPVQRPRRDHRPPIDPADTQGQLARGDYLRAASDHQRTRPVDIADGVGRLTWAGHTMEWHPTAFPVGSDIVPHGVDANTTLSYIACPLIADAIGHSEWFPPTVCVRPARMGVEWRDGGYVLDADQGPTWDMLVAAVRACLGRHFGDGTLPSVGPHRPSCEAIVVSRLNFRLHWTRQDQEAWCGSGLVCTDGSDVWDTMQNYGHAIIRVRERFLARAAAAAQGTQAERGMTPEVAFEHFVFDEVREAYAAMGENPAELAANFLQLQEEDHAAATRRFNQGQVPSVNYRDESDDFCRGHVPLADPAPAEVCLICQESLDAQHYRFDCCDVRMCIADCNNWFLRLFANDLGVRGYEQHHRTSTSCPACTAVAGTQQYMASIDQDERARGILHNLLGIQQQERQQHARDLGRQEEEERLRREAAAAEGRRAAAAAAARARVPNRPQTNQRRGRGTRAPRRGAPGRAEEVRPPPPRMRHPAPDNVGPLTDFDWDAPEWRATLRAMSAEDKDNCPYVTLDDMHANYKRVFGLVAIQVAQRIVDHDDDREVRILFGLLPRLLLVDRRFTRMTHGARIDLFMERVRSALSLRDLPRLLERRDTSTRTQASSVRTDERTTRDVVKSCQRGQYSRAGNLATASQVAENNDAADVVTQSMYPPAILPDDLPDVVASERPPLDREHFMHMVGADGQGRVKVGSAADSAGWRWEHIEWMVEAGGAEILYTLCDRLWRGLMQDDDDADWSWVFNAKLVLFIKKINERTLRHEYGEGDLRAIAPGSILLRLISGVGAKHTRKQFGRLFDPGCADGTDNADCAPVMNAGAAMLGAAEQVQHSAMEVLASRPDHYILQTDGKMAFQLVNRQTFLEFQHRHRLPTYTWSKRCYGKRTVVYLRMKDGSIRAYFRDGGTAQGDPLSPGNQCMGLQEALQVAQTEFPDKLGSRQLWYMDDGSVGGALEDLEVFITIIGSDDFKERTGYYINFDKSSIWGRDLIQWDEGEIEWMDTVAAVEAAERDNVVAAEARRRLQAALPPSALVIRGVRDPTTFHDDPSKVADEIRANRGVTLLGAPICGTADYAERHIMGIVRKADEYVDRLRHLLLPDHYEEYMAMIRTTLPGRFAHVCRAVVPSRVFGPAKAFDVVQLRAYAAGVGSLGSEDLPTREVIFSQEAAGGRGLREMATECINLYDGAWGQSAHRISRRWAPGDARGRDIGESSFIAYMAFGMVDGECLARLGLDHRDHLRRAHATVEAVHGRGLDAATHGAGTILDQLRPTGLRVPPEPPPPLSSYSTTTRARLTAEFAVFTTAVRFEHIMRVASQRGRAQFRDMSVAGAGQWLRARPPRDDEDARPFTRFPPGGARIAHRAALLLRPPGATRFCHGCWHDDAWSSFLHLGTCSHGVRLTPVLHHPVKHVLIEMLRAVFGPARVLDGDLTPGGFVRQHGDHPREEWWRRYSRFKRPDIIVTNWPGNGAHTIIDVKTFEAAARTHVRQDHTDTYTLGAHVELERSLITEYITERREGREVARHERQRAIYSNELICAAVSRQGAIGSQLRSLITQLAGMHAQRARDGPTTSYSFEEVWRHRLSLCVHTRAATQILALASAAEGEGAAPAAVELAAREGMTAAWMQSFFAAGAQLDADAAVERVVHEMTAVGDDPPAEDEAAEADEADEEDEVASLPSTVVESEVDEEVAAGAEALVAEAVRRLQAEAEVEAEAVAMEEEDGDRCGVCELPRCGWGCECIGGGAAAARRRLREEEEAAAAAVEAAVDAAACAAADAEVEMVTGPHRPTHPDALSSGPVAPPSPARGADGEAVECELGCEVCEGECQCAVGRGSCRRVYSPGRGWRDRDAYDELD